MEAAAHVIATGIEDQDKMGNLKFDRKHASGTILVPVRLGAAVDLGASGWRNRIIRSEARQHPRIGVIPLGALTASLWDMHIGARLHCTHYCPGFVEAPTMSRFSA